MPRRRSDEGGRVTPAEHFLSEAEWRGQEAGNNAASWVFDARMSDSDFRRIKKMLDDGDPKVENYIREPEWLSGQWAGESIKELLGDIIEEAEEHGHDIEDDILEAYQTAASDEFWTEVHLEVERHLGDSYDDEDDDDDDDDDEEGAERDY